MESIEKSIKGYKSIADKFEDESREGTERRQHLEIMAGNFPNC